MSAIFCCRNSLSLSNELWWKLSHSLVYSSIYLYIYDLSIYSSAIHIYLPSHHLSYLDLFICLYIHPFNPLKTSPEYTRAGVYGKCVLYQNQIVFNRLIAYFKLINLPFTLFCSQSSLSYSLLNFSIFWAQLMTLPYVPFLACVMSLLLATRLW